ncbi:MAG: peroxide stress protein YaaA [Gammaproteobacteria bacterium]
MLIVVSPAKSLDYESKVRTRKFTQPQFLEDSEKLVESLRKLKPEDLSELMNISDNLAEENYQRYANWHTPFDRSNARQAIFAFKGDVYLGLEAEQFSSADLDFAQKHLRILSGLYGILRPLDLMQPYRLEMGRQFAAGKAKNLYEYWGSRLTESLKTELGAQPKNSQVLINLASNEYFSALQAKELGVDIVTPQFKDWSSGKYRVLSFFAKKARGQMAAYIIRNRIKSPEKLKDFSCEGYRYDEAESSAQKLVFKRKQKP